jgi:hypothetical protein
MPLPTLIVANGSNKLAKKIQITYVNAMDLALYDL